MLYIVATPIGNLKDITLRAIEVLKNVDLIACEDTRHSRILLKSYHINTPTTSYYQHNRFSKAQYLISRLKSNADIALISDAGMPGILDPGHHLINLAIKNNIPITAVPGPTALVMALVLSGQPTHEFIFAGFLPNRASARRRRLEELRRLDYTILFYESRHRIIATLQDIQDIFGDIPLVVTRELTKKFEEILRLKVSQIRECLVKKKPRGEFVVVI
ncbi:MAG: 16S rRNA (cytidine(1402)-2'-O)-methyltransferase [Candidatus Omnitrophota bacterium]|jgi:16S rRNA (cytidine1402-2'-O)-methyltransferase